MIFNYFGFMFIILLNYIATLEEIDQNMSEHVKFLKKYYDSGHFLTSGRKIPRTGGVIVAAAKEKKELESIVKEDPFYKKKLAKFEIIEFSTSMMCEEMKPLVERFN